MRRNIVIGGIIVIAMAMVWFILNPNEEDILHSDTIEETIALGLNLMSITGDEILEKIAMEDEVVLFFIKDGAIGMASISLKNNQWYWFRTGGLIGFSGTKDVGYNDHGITITTFNGKEYLASVGEIYDYNIEKMTINDQHTVTIKEYGNKRYWLCLLKSSDDYKGFRTFDINGEELIES